MTQELIFRTQVQTGKSAKDVDNLADSLAEVGKEAKNVGSKGAESLATLNKRVEEGNFTMREAAKLVKEYGAIALSAGRESPVGQEAIRRAGELSDTLGDLRTEIQNAGTDGANLKAGLELASTVTAGYGALQGAIALTGVENEALAQTFVKLQAVQSVLTGIEQVRAALEKESLVVTKGKVVWTKVATAAEYVYAVAVGTTTGAMKALRIAMLAIPIIAIIAGIIALISALASFLGEEEKAEKQNDALNASFERQNEALEANGRASKRNADNKRALMVSNNATAEELFNFDKQRLADEEKLRRKNLQVFKESIPQKTAAYKQALKEENYELAKKIRDETKQMRDKYKGFRELDGQYAVDKQLLENNYRNEQAKKEEEAQKEAQQRAREQAKKNAERRAAEAQKKLDEARLLEDLIVQNIKDSDNRKLAQLKLQQARELAEVRKKYGDESAVSKELEKKQLEDYYNQLEEFRLTRDEANNAEQAKKITDAELSAELSAELDRKNAKALLEGKLIQAREDFALEQELKLELAQLEREQALQQKDLTEGEKFKIEQEYAAKKEELDIAQKEKEKEREKQVQEASKQVLTLGLEASQSLADAFFDYKIGKAAKGSAEEIRLEKKKFEVNKKLQIAQAIMQGAQATLAAFSSGASIPIVGPVAGPAFAAAAGITAALNVAKIRNTQFESGGGGTSTPSVSAPSVSVPSVQGENTTTTTTQTQSLAGSTSPTQVVLVDSVLKAGLADNTQVQIVSSVG